VEPKKDGRLGRDIRCIRKAALVWKIQTQNGTGGLRMRRHPAEYSRRLSDCRSRNEKTDFLSDH
jgi:hypothetical protein